MPFETNVFEIEPRLKQGVFGNLFFSLKVSQSVAAKEDCLFAFFDQYGTPRFICTEFFGQQRVRALVPGYLRVCLMYMP